MSQTIKIINFYLFFNLRQLLDLTTRYERWKRNVKKLNSLILLHAFSFYAKKTGRIKRRQHSAVVLRVTFDQLLKGRHQKKHRLLVKRPAEFLLTDVDFGGQVKIQRKRKLMRALGWL